MRTTVSLAELESSASQTAETTPATIATTSASSAGQIQSPGYQPRCRRQRAPSRVARVGRAGSRSPHSRQYSWPSLYGVPQRGQRRSSSGATQRSQGSDECRIVSSTGDSSVAGFGAELGLRLRLVARLDRPAAVRAEGGVGREWMPAALAGDHRLRAHRPPAVRAEVRAPGNRRATLTRRRRPPRGRDRLEHRVELAEPVLERDDLPAVLDQQLVAEARAAVHLEREPAEMPDPLLTGLHDRAPLAPEGTR